MPISQCKPGLSNQGFPQDTSGPWEVNMPGSHPATGIPIAPITAVIMLSKFPFPSPASIPAPAPGDRVVGGHCVQDRGRPGLPT